MMMRLFFILLFHLIISHQTHSSHLLANKQIRLDLRRRLEFENLDELNHAPNTTHYFTASVRLYDD